MPQLLNKYCAVLVLFITLDYCSAIFVPKLVTHTGWYGITSRQKTSLNKQPQAPIWRVEEYFSFDRHISYSLYTQVAQDTNEKRYDPYISLDHNGKLFYLKKGKCQLDQRQELTTAYPWRYVGYAYSIRAASIRGIGGLWLNALENHVNCRRKDNLLNCAYGQELRKTDVALDFKYQADGSTRSLQQVSVDYKMHLHSNSTTFLQDILFEATVESVSTSLTDRLIEDVEKSLKLCQDSLKDEQQHLFPSLMRKLGQSYKRSYFGWYQVSYFEEGNTYSESEIDPPLEASYSMREWFSYEQEIQALQIQRQGDKNEEKYNRFLGLRDARSKQTASFHLESQFLEWIKCSPGDLMDEKLIKMSSLFKRKIHFIRKSDNNIELFEFHAGTLIGLGALLMNVADIPKKRLLINDKTSTWHSGDKSGSLEWVVKDHEPGQWIYLHFYKTAAESSSTFDLEHLKKIEITRFLEGNGLNSEPRESLVARIMVNKFHMSLYSFELDSAFVYPKHKCPDLAGFEPAYDSQGSSITEAPILVDDDYLNAVDEPYEFPSFDEYLELTRDYSIESEWKTDIGDIINMAEYLIIGGTLDTMPKQEYHFGRLDISRYIKEEDKKEEYRLYISYLTGTLIQYDDRLQQCHSITKPDDWLTKLSAEFKFGQYADDNSKSQSVERLRHYGIGGLWSLATRSPYLTFVHQSSKSETQDEFSIWRLEDLPDFKKISITYNLTRLDQKSEGYRQKFRLNSIKIHADDWQAFKGIAEIDITIKEVKVGAIPTVKFLLPQTCEEHGYLFRLTKFPSFADTFKVKSPKDLEFELKYDANIFLKRTGYMLQVREANKVDGKQLGLVAMSTHLSNIHFWLDDNNIFLMEDPRTKQCKVGVDPIRFLKWYDYFDILTDNLHDVLANWSSFPLAELWHFFGLRAEQLGDSSQLVERTVDRVINGVTQRNLEWIFTHANGLEITFNFIHLHSDDDLSLHHVEIRRQDQDFHEFNIKLSVKSIEVDPYKKDPTKITQKSSGCHDKSKLEFPKISEIFIRGDVINLNSELVRPKEQERFTIDEWLQVGKAMRLRVGETTDYLLYPETSESFDISNTFSCGPVADEKPSDEASREITGDDFVLDSLFRAMDGNAFYGPLTLWSLAEMPAFKVERVMENIDYFGLFEHETSWFAAEQFHVIHKRNSKFDYIIEFSQESMNGVHAIAPQAIKLLDWRFESSDEAPSIVIEVNNFNVIKSLELNLLQNSHKIVDNFRIPFGLGCQRGKEATRAKLLNDLQDVTIFDPLIPTEFEYRASLSLMDYTTGQLEAQPLVLSGWFGRCPDNWNQKAYGGLVINTQRRHHFNGTVESERKAICKETTGGQVTQQRSLNEINGDCSIWRKPEKQTGIVTLNFGGEYQIEVPGDWIYFMPSLSSQVVQVIVGRDRSEPTIVVYETRVNDLKLTNAITGMGSIVRTFERDRDIQPYGKNLYHTSVKVDIYLLNRAHFSLQLRDLRLTQCYRILKAMEVESCYVSSDYLRATGHIDPVDRIHELHVKFMGASANVNESRLIDFERLKEEIEDRVADQIIGSQLALVGLNGLQLGQVRAAFHPQDRSITAKVNLMEKPPAIDWFAELPGKTILRRPSLIRTKMLNSKYDCSKFCESMSECFAFSFCPNTRECRVIDIDLWIYELVRYGDLTDKTLTENLNHLMVKDDPWCTTYHSPTGSPSKSLNGGTLESMKGLIENKMHFHIMVNPNTLEIHDYLAVEFRILNKAADALGPCEEADGDFDSLALNNDFVFGTIKLDAQLQASDETLNRIATIKSSSAVMESSCLNSCLDSPANCQLVSFCNHLCVTVANLTDYESYSQVLTASQPQDGCSILGRDFVHDFHRFSFTSEPKDSLAKLENVTLADCATRCHFKEGKELAIDCLSFEFCTQDDRELGTCYLQKLHIIMDDFDENILNQESSTMGDKRAHCAHYSKSLLADYQAINGRKFKHHDSIVHKGATIDNCALICRRTETCLGFEFCEPDKNDDESKASCYLRRLAENDTSTLGEQLKFDLEKSDNCNVFRMRHAPEEYEKSANKLEVVDADYQDFTASTGVIFSLVICLTLALFLGWILNIVYTLFTGHPIPSPITCLRSLRYQS